jgi:hypothetical protein
MSVIGLDVGYSNLKIAVGEAGAASPVRPHWSGSVSASAHTTSPTR